MTPNPGDLALKTEAALAQVAQVVDLDDGSYELLEVIPANVSGAGRGSPQVHSMLLFRHQDQRFYAKPEVALRSLRDPEARDYRSFAQFALSLFQCGPDATTPLWRYQATEAPESPLLELTQAQVLKHQSTMRRVEAEGSRPGDPLWLKDLYRFFQMQQASLVDRDGETYETFFSHQGRDLISEVIASALAQLLDLPVPYNRLAIRREEEQIGQGPQSRCVWQSRYLLSQALSEAPQAPNLAQLIEQTYRNQLHQSEFIEDLKTAWHDSNPLGLAFFTEQVGEAARQRAELCLGLLSHPEDLIASDLFDRLLGGKEDRKLSDYLLPQGPGGRIYTLDYGEAFFGELGLEPQDPHYLHQRNERFKTLGEDFERLRRLPGGGRIKGAWAGLLGRLVSLPKGFFRRLIEATPPQFTQAGPGVEGCCCHLGTLADYLESLNQLCRHYFGLSGPCQPQAAQARILDYFREGAA